MPSKSPGAGWRRVTCQPLRPCFCRLLEELGVVLGDRHRDRRSGSHRTRRRPAAGRAGRPRTPRRPWRGGGWPGRPGGPSTAPPPGPRRAARSCGSRCWRSRASAISFIPVSVDTPRAAATGSGANAETAGVPVPAQGLVLMQHAGQGVAGPGGDAGVGGRGVQHAPLRGQPQLAPLRRRGPRSSSPRAGRGASRRRGPRPPPAVPSRPLRAWINPSMRAPTVRPRKARG